MSKLCPCGNSLPFQHRKLCTQCKPLRFYTKTPHPVIPPKPRFCKSCGCLIAKWKQFCAPCNRKRVLERNRACMRAHKRPSRVRVPTDPQTPQEWNAVLKAYGLSEGRGKPNWLRYGHNYDWTDEQGTDKRRTKVKKSHDN